jgi:hypothetical protein
MLAAGYMGEAGYINAMLGFIVGIVGWAYILYEIFFGESWKSCGRKSPGIGTVCIFNNALDRYNWLGSTSSAACRH